MTKFKTETDQLDMLTGILVPVSKVMTDLDLYTFDEQKYRILESDVSAELLNCLFKKIEVRGNIDIDNKGEKTLCPINWKIIESIK